MNYLQSDLRVLRSVIITLAAGIAALCLWVLWHHVFSYVTAFRFDDSYISLRYAHNLARHGVLSFNVDDRIDGFSSPGWVVIMSAADFLRIDAEKAMLTLSMLFGLFGAAGAVVLARCLGASWAMAIAMAGIGTMSMPGYVVWSAPGMEMPYVATVSVLLLASMSVPPRGRLEEKWLSVLQVVLVVLVVTARPEGIVLGGAVLALATRNTIVSIVCSRNWRGPVICFVPYVVAGGVIAAMFVAHWIYYRWPLPNTYYAKVVDVEMLEHGKMDLIEFINQRALWLSLPASILVAAAGIGGSRSYTLRVSGPAAASVAFIVWASASCWVYARAGGDFHGFHRFYQPLVPSALAFLAAAMTISVPTGPTHRAAAALAAVMIGAFLYWSGETVLRDAYKNDAGQIRTSTVMVEEWRVAGLTLLKNYPTGTSMVVRAAGIIPYVSGLPSIDMLALNNLEVSHGNIQLNNVPGHQKEATPAQIVKWHPDLIVHHPNVEMRDRTGNPTHWIDAPEYRDAGYQFRCIPLAEENTRRWLCLWEAPGVKRLQ